MKYVNTYIYLTGFVKPHKANNWIMLIKKGELTFAKRL